MNSELTYLLKNLESQPDKNKLISIKDLISLIKESQNTRNKEEIEIELNYDPNWGM